MYVITFLYIFSIIFYVLYAYIPFPSVNRGSQMKLSHNISDTAEKNAKMDPDNELSSGGA